MKILQPLAYYFGVTLDELMGYNQEKIQAEIDEMIALYKKHLNDGKGHEIIAKAYHEHPSDYRIMHYYMWDVAGDLADNDPALLIAHKDEFLAICKKIIEGCTEENLRLGAWNMRAKILHAEGKTDEALEIYQIKFTDWYNTGAQKAEQLFAKNTGEYYFLLQKNLYQLAAFAADKLGKTVFFDPALSMEEKTACALRYGDLMLNAFEQTKDVFFLVIAMQFLGRMENDLCYRGGTAEDVAAVMEKHLYAAKKLEQAGKNNKALYQALDSFSADAGESLFDFMLKERTDAIGGRRAALLKADSYAAVLEKFK